MNKFPTFFSSLKNDELLGSISTVAALGLTATVEESDEAWKKTEETQEQTADVSAARSRVPYLPFPTN